MKFLLALVMLADLSGQLDLEHAWQVSKGAGVVVGVVDTGVDDGRPALAGAVLPGAEFPELGTGTRDRLGHGTDVAELVVGVAPEAKILPVKLSGNSVEANAAIRWAVDHGARVLNLSLGSSAKGTFDESLRYAAEHDVVVVAAAGNAGTDDGVTAPANGFGVLAVSAVDGSGKFRPDVSVEGPEVALAAPGVEVTSSGRSGTSFAAAIVSGSAALVRAAHPELSAPEVVDLLTSTARDAGPQGRDPQYGHGIVDPARAVTSTPAHDAGAGFVWWLVAGVLGLAGALAALLHRKKKRTDQSLQTRPGGVNAQKTENHSSRGGRGGRVVAGLHRPTGHSRTRQDR
ncbi:S8 family serine peptidase [Lentzea sp. NEAU-D13]|uniref:S8 family serine peptidase n=1 Tax=Lentzea alba TaxID=2714351 RepID=A0A7C9VZV0_9PSEU|nr:S8 family serine peptidase [Lentzea alba]NGY61897.1 S8 family serine peptidase [Lentzea alba]